MKISYLWLKKYIDLKSVSPKKVADLLTMHSFEVEGVEKVKGDYVLDVDVLPNRAHDALSHLGVARELGAILNKKVKEPKIKLEENKKLKTKDYISVSVKNEKLCRRYTARVVLDVSVKESPKWLKEKMEAIGQKSINNIVDATNYVMFSLGQPLHAFDLDKIEGSEIRVKKAKDKDVVETLGGEKYTLDKDILTISDKKGVLAIAGIKGGTKAEIDKNTKNIVIESANFDPVLIRKTSKKLGLRTDSSLRFENEVTEVLAKEALDAVSALVLELSGGELPSGFLDTKRGEYKKRTLVFSSDEINEILGIDIKEKEILNILKRLGFEVLKSKKNGFYILKVPFERLDISLKEDIAEEVLRLYGYENVKSKAILGELWPAKRNNKYFFSEKARDILVGLGFSDVYNYSFVSDFDISLLSKNKNQIKLLNPLSEEKKYLRDSLTFHILNNLKENLKHKKSVRIFELGEVFFRGDNGKISERKMISGAISYKKKESLDAFEFYELKGALELFLQKMGAVDFYFDDEYEDFFNLDVESVFHLKRFANIKLAGEKIGVLGELKQPILKEKSIKFKSAIFELDFSRLVELLSEEYVYKKISKFPSVVFDIAILCERNTKVASVQSVIENAGGELLSDVELFDIYQDENSSEILNKSFAFHLVFQADDRTLKDQEVEVMVKNIAKSIREKGWDIKGEF